MQQIKLSEATAARREISIYMVDATDGYTEETGLTLAGTISKNGGAFGACAGTFTEVATGFYKYAPTVGEIDTLGRVDLRVTSAGARAFPVTVQVVAFDPFDAVRMGLTALPNAVAGANGGLPTGDGSGRVTVGSLVAGAIVAATFGAGAIDAAAIASGAIDADAIATDAGTEIANAILDLSNGVETSITVRQAMRLVLAVLAGTAVRAGDVTNFRRRDGATVAVSVTATGDGSRSDSTLGTL